MTTREEILDQVQGVFRKVLNDPSVTRLFLRLRNNLK